MSSRPDDIYSEQYRRFRGYPYRRFPYGGYPYGGFPYGGGCPYGVRSAQEQGGCFMTPQGPVCPAPGADQSCYMTPQGPVCPSESDEFGY